MEVYVNRIRNAKGASVRIEQSMRIIFLVTNNVAEYEAILLDLKELKELGAKHIGLHGDSRLSVNQVLGTFELKSKK